MSVPSKIRELCPTFLAGRCDGERQIICGTCGGSGHGNCYGNGRGPIEILCSREFCAGYDVQIAQLERAVIEAATTWREDYDMQRGSVASPAEVLNLRETVDALIFVKSKGNQ